MPVHATQLLGKAEIYLKITHRGFDYHKTSVAYLQLLQNDTVLTHIKSTSNTTSNVHCSAQILCVQLKLFLKTLCASHSSCTAFVVRSTIAYIFASNRAIPML